MEKEANQILSAEEIRIKWIRRTQSLDYCVDEAMKEYAAPLQARIAELEACAGHWMKQYDESIGRGTEIRILYEAEKQKSERLLEALTQNTTTLIGFKIKAGYFEREFIEKRIDENRLIITTHKSTNKNL